MTTIPTGFSVVDAYEQQRVGVAQRQGFALFCVRPEGETPGFVYTIGMSQHQLPELLAFFPGDESTGQSVANLVTQICQRMIGGLERFDRIALIRALVHTGIHATDPDVDYSFEFLTGDDFTHALQAYVTRATRYRERLGTPRGVLVMQHPDVPSFRAIRAGRMLAIS